MSISTKVRAVLALKSLKNTDLAKCYGISHQATRNKLHRGSFTAEELIALCDLVGATLTIDLGDGQTIILDKNDIRKPESEV